jgi:hypothetical protein
MASFTSLLNRAHRRFIDKCLHKRIFNACEACEKRTLLIHHVQRDGKDVCEWDLCNECYESMVDEEIP